MSRDALNARKHVICEKPLVMISDEAFELVQLAQKYSLVNAVGFNLSKKRFKNIMNTIMRCEGKPTLI